MNESEAQTLDHLKREFRQIGYVGDLLQENYSFAQVLTNGLHVASIPLAAFAQEPPSYRNACFGVVVANGKRGAPFVEEYRSLGAPQVLEIRDQSLHRWKMTSLGAPELLDEVGLDGITSLFKQYRQDWAPHRLLSVKTGRDATVVQLDFFDLGLLPLIEREVRSKLDRLLRDTVTLAVDDLRRRGALKPNTHTRLFRLLFRLLAAKLLADRGHPGSWLNEDPGQTIASVEDFYFKGKDREPVLDDVLIQDLIWDAIRKGFHFQNLSVNTLAYVYENTLVTTEARRTLGIHGTPPEIAEYIIGHLPIDNLPVEDRRVFEPFSGHAVFLVAAMQRLRDLLPPATTPKERHAYFVNMLAGLEIDDFAREVAMLSLMLADYPNPDGWRLLSGDAFASPLFDQELGSANIVVSNPPFEDFGPEQRSYPDISSVRKPAELLLRILNVNPQMIGIVLPRIFLHGRGYEQIRSELMQKYGSVEVLALPDRVFQHSEADIVLLLAYDAGRRTSRLLAGEVYDHDLRNFYLTHKPSYQRERSSSPEHPPLDPTQIWLDPLDEVWNTTASLEKLGTIADIHRGIEYSLPFRENVERLVSTRRKSGFMPGVQTVEGSIEPFVITGSVYLNMSTEVQRTLAYTLPWDGPKLFVNARRRTRGHWKITAAPDRQGLACYQNFHAIWPTIPLSLEVLAAILNGPVANAFVATHEAQRDIRIGTLRDIPIPSMTPDEQELTSSLVRQYIETRVQARRRDRQPSEVIAKCKALLMQIDAEVLKAYDLSPRLERAVLDYFRGHERPGPVEFDEYFPEDFKPYLPWHRYISQEVERATARSTLGRLPVVDDAAVSEALSQID